MTAPWAVCIGVLGRLPFLKTRNQHRQSQNLSAGSCGRKECNIPSIVSNFGIKKIILFVLVEISQGFKTF
jgi:hypothetical protein